MRWQAPLMLLLLAACAVPQRASPPPRSPAASPQAAAPPRAARPAPAPPVWRVARAGITGCVDPAALRLLRPATPPDAAALRSLAAARAEGGCVTVFPAQSWRLVERGTEMLRLAPVAAGGREAAGAQPGPLFFWRDEVVEDRGG